MIRFTELLKQFRQVIITVAVLILIFLLWRGCGKKGNEEADKLKARIDTLLIDNEAAKKESFRWAIVVNELRDSADVYRTQRDEFWTALVTSKNKYARLAGKVIGAKILHDTLSYITNCDSLAEMRDALLWEIDQYNMYVNQLQTASDSTILYKDSIIWLLHEQNNSLTKGLEYASRVIPKIKIRNEVYAGIDGYGNEQNIFGGYIGKVGLLTKKGQFYNVGIGMINKDKYYSIGFLSRISFRKH